MTSRSLILGSVSLAVLTGPLGMAVAQGSPEGDQPKVYEKVVVTAQKREQSLQDVPIVVTAISGELLADAGVRDIKDLTILTPGLLVTSTSNESVTTARIRGVGTVGDNPGLESSVGVVIDGVVRARNGVGFGDLGELERVEVLKGPQGTLFGRSTSSGAINIISKAPADEFGAGAALSAGNFGYWRGEGYITGPIGDTVAGRLYGVINKRDGYLDVNTAIGPRSQTDDGNSDYTSLRGQLLIEPSEDFSIRLIADYTDRDEMCCAAPVSVVGPTAPLVNSLAGGNGTATTSGTQYDRLAYSNRDTTQKISDSGLSAEISWKLDMGDLTSITAFRSWDLDTAQDSDFSGADIWLRDAGNNSVAFDNFSQEVRLAGATETLDWLVGFYYATEDLERVDNLRLGNQYYSYFASGLLSGLPAVLGLTPANSLLPNDGTNDTYNQDGTSYAIFTNNTLALSPAFEVTFGARWTHDEKDLDTRYNTVGGSCSRAVAGQATLFNYLTTVAMQSPAVAQATTATIVGNLCLPWTNDLFTGRNTSQSFSDDDISGTLKGAYRFSEQVLGYVSYSRGYKAGGFNLDRSSSGTGLPDFSAGVLPVTDTSFPAETVNSYEIGWKTNSPSGRLAFNGALFYQEYSDFQLNTFLGTSFIVTSIPSVTSQGVDVDMSWAPAEMDGLTLQGGITFAETQYDEFTPVNPSLSALPGTRISFAPRWSGSIAATYDTAFAAGWNARWNIAARYTSDYNTGSNLDVRKLQEAFALVNGRVSFYSDDSPFTIELWAQNLLDEDYTQVAFDTPLQSGSISNFLGAPRTYGVTLKADF